MSFLKISSLSSRKAASESAVSDSDSDSDSTANKSRGRADKRRSITSFLLGKGYKHSKSISPPSRSERKRRASGEDGRARSPSAERGILGTVDYSESEAETTDRESTSEATRKGSVIVPANAFTDDEEEDQGEEGQGGQLDQSSSDDDDDWAPVNAKARAHTTATQRAPATIEQDDDDEWAPVNPAAIAKVQPVSEVQEDDDDGWDPVPPATAKTDTIAPTGLKSTAHPTQLEKAKNEGDEIDMAKELQLYRNTEANTGDQTVFSANRIYETEIYNAGLMLPQEEDEHPNLVHTEGSVPSPPLEGAASSPTTKKAKHRDVLQLQQSLPSWETNRCTIVLEHGDPAAAGAKSRRVRSFLVASDLSDEAKYAVEWAIGTVLRDGDSAIFVTVIETDTKLDTPDMYPEGSTHKATTKNQQDRLERVEILAKQAAALLVRTRLNLNITCQAIHAKNARHMIVDMIDFVEPTMVIVGSRGTTKIKGMLLGSVSHYLVQKSSVPVMVARRRLRRTGPKRKPTANLDRHARVPLGHAETEKESHAGQIQHEKDKLREEEEEDETELDRKQSIGSTEIDKRPSFQGEDEGTALQKIASDVKDPSL